MKKQPKKTKDVRMLTVEEAVTILAGISIGAIINISNMVECNTRLKQLLLLEELIERLKQKV